MKKVIVTGAGGFIGSHLCEKLVKLGYDTKAFIFYNSSSSWGWLDYSDEKIKSNLEVFLGDVRDPNGVRSAIKGCDIVINLAALIGIPYSYNSPDSYIDTNIKGALNILQASKELGIEKIIQTSTSEVYGSALKVPIDEDHPLQGQSPYSASKIGADQLALSFYRSFETPVGILRPFNTYGPRQSARAVIPTIITQIKRGIQNIRLGSITPTRDFSYIEDTVNGFISAMNSEKFIGEVVNLGSGFEISIEETTKIISDLMNAEINISSDEERIRPKKSEVERLFSNNEKAMMNIDWKPKYNGISGFKEGLKNTIEWFGDEKNLSSYKTNIFNY